MTERATCKNCRYGGAEQKTPDWRWCLFSGGENKEDEPCVFFVRRSEAEQILKALWDATEGNFIFAKEASGDHACILCYGEARRGPWPEESVFVHEETCPAIRLEAYAKAQGWVEE